MPRSNNCQRTLGVHRGSHCAESKTELLLLKLASMGFKTNLACYEESLTWGYVYRLCVSFFMSLPPTFQILEL